MTRRLLVWGSSGHAKVLREALLPADVEVVAVVDNDPAAVSPFADIAPLHGWAGLDDWQASADVRPECAVVAIGGARGLERAEIGEQLARRGFEPITVVHSAAYVASDATLGRGVQVLAGAVVGAEATIGDWSIVNTAASVDHESTLGRGCHIAPGARLAGCVTVEDGVMVGAGAVVLPRVRIGEGAVVGAGAVVLGDIAPYTVVLGNPATPRHARDPR